MKILRKLFTKPLAAGLLAASLVSPVMADKLYVGQITHHFSDSEEITNQRHELLVYEHESRWGGGYFKNSYNKDTFVIGRSFPIKSDGKNEVGVKLFLSKGYEDHFNNPLIGTIYFDVGNISINILPTEFIGVGLLFKL